MNSIEVYIVVEGQTEQTFVRDVLAPYMAYKSIYLYPLLIGKRGHKGGKIDFERAKTDIGNCLKQRQNTYVSTMFDYYGIDINWVGKAEINQKIANGANFSALEKASLLEDKTFQKIVEIFPEFNPTNRFIPYIEMHEFEALLFSDVDILADKTGIELNSLRGVIEQYETPEEINDNSATAPSKRLISLKKSSYRKVVMGKAITEAIGIPKIRNKCSHFNQWLTTLENLKMI